MTDEHRIPDRTAGRIERPDELIFLVLDGEGHVVDAGIDEFLEIERVSPKYIRLTLRGRDETKPVVLRIESDSKITVRDASRKDGVGP
jgi:hypothetical protein